MPQDADEISPILAHAASHTIPTSTMLQVAAAREEVRENIVVVRERTWEENIHVCHEVDTCIKLVGCISKV